MIQVPSISPHGVGLEQAAGFLGNEPTTKEEDFLSELIPYALTNTQGCILRKIRPGLGQGARGILSDATEGGGVRWKRKGGNVKERRKMGGGGV